MAKEKIIVGARASLLSVAQAYGVIRLLKRNFPQHCFLLKRITTSGDKDKYWQHSDVGIFVKELQEALLTGKIDLAIHSVKDLPSQTPRALKLAAIPKREDPRDCLVLRGKTTLSKLKKGALIGTSSLRRSAQLLHWRPDLKIVGLRGNLDTRLRKLTQLKLEAIVVALAGIIRLGYKNLNLQRISPKIILPAAGQGALGIEVRAKDKRTGDIVKTINHQESFLCVSCERAFLREFGAGCRLPLGALAESKNKRIHLQAAVISLDGKRIVRLSRSAPLQEAEPLGKLLAKEVLAKGGREIMQELKNIEK